MRVFRHTAVRSAAALLALLWVIVPALGSFHSDSHTHRFCAEHQTIEEGENAATVPAGIAAAPETISEHERCAFLAFSVRPSVEPVTGVSSESFALTTAQPGSGFARAFVSVELLHRAPKASPPLA